MFHLGFKSPLISSLQFYLWSESILSSIDGIYMFCLFPKGHLMNNCNGMHMLFLIDFFTTSSLLIMNADFCNFWLVTSWMSYIFLCTLFTSLALPLAISFSHIVLFINLYYRWLFYLCIIDSYSEWVLLCSLCCIYFHPVYRNVLEWQRGLTDYCWFLQTNGKLFLESSL